METLYEVLGEKALPTSKQGRVLLSFLELDTEDKAEREKAVLALFTEAQEYAPHRGSFERKLAALDLQEWLDTGKVIVEMK